MRATRSTRFVRNLSALALTILVLLAVSAERIHNADVDHAVCPEHGEIVHASGDHAAARAAADNESGSPRIVPVEAAGDHHHCGIATLVKGSSVPWTLSEACSYGHADSVVARIRTRRDPDRPLATLCFAPKHSPPSREV